MTGSGSYWPQFWVGDADADSIDEILVFMGDNAMYYAESSYNALTDNENKIWKLDVESLSGFTTMGAAVSTKLAANGSDAVTDIHFSNDGSLLIGQGFLHDGNDTPGNIAIVDTFPTSNSSLSIVADATLSGVQSERFGQSVTSGDFDGDGDLEFVVSAPGIDSNNAGGKVYYFNREPSSLNSTQSASNIDDHIFIGTGARTDFGLGFEVQNIGDFDNDGIDDVLVSDYNQYSSPDGEVRVVSGDCMNQGATLNNATILKITSTGSQTDFASSISTGDIDGDGNMDISIGAYSYRVDVPLSSAPEGSVFVYLSSQH